MSWTQTHTHIYTYTHTHTLPSFLATEWWPTVCVGCSPFTWTPSHDNMRSWKRRMCDRLVDCRRNIDDSLSILTATHSSQQQQQQHELKDMGSVVVCYRQDKKTGQYVHTYVYVWGRHGQVVRTLFCRYSPTTTTCTPSSQYSFSYSLDFFCWRKENGDYMHHIISCCDDGGTDCINVYLA